MDFDNSMSIYSATIANIGSTNSASKFKSKSSIEETAFANLFQQSTERLVSASDRNEPKSYSSNSFLSRLWSARQLETADINKAPKPARGDAAIEFTYTILHPAQYAAKKLGTTPAAVIAIAAHETGWGKSIAKNTEHSSHNLFGIKAFGADKHAKISANTTEYIDGIKINLKQPFRRYESFAESIADFVNFLQSNPRYAAALEHAANPKVFIEKIQSAGYATDPNYATKVKRVMGQVENILQTQTSTSAVL